MRTLHIFYSVLAILLFCTIDSRADTGFSIQFPPVGSFVENELLNVVLKVDQKSLDRIRVVSPKNDPLEVAIRHGSNTACFGITLNKGMNTIQLIGLNRGEVIVQKELTVFFRSDLFFKFRVPPSGFKRYYFHFVDNEKSCVSCHDMEPTLSSLRPQTPEDSPCYTCHARKDNNSFTHQPAAQWTCFSCHEVQRGERKYTAPKPDQKVCYPCHNYEVKDWKKKKLMHGPTAVGHCTLCHNPHGSSWPALLKMQTTDLCVNCHEDKATGVHVIAGFYGKGHPVRGVRHPLIPDKEFTCAGCHNPHAGNSQNLLHQENNNMTAYCTFCHDI